MSAVTGPARTPVSPGQASDDGLAREVLSAASYFTSALMALSGGLRGQRPELAAHLQQLAAEVAGCVLDAAGTWPLAGRR